HLLVWPPPAGDIGPVCTVLERVVPAGDLLVAESFQSGAADSLQSRNVLNRIHGQSEAINPVLDRQLQRRIDVAFFPVTVDVEVGMVPATVSQAMDKPRISVEIENDGFVWGKEQIEISLRQPVRMICPRL